MQRRTNKPILVLGAGSWGTALALLLQRNAVETHSGHEIRLWSYDAKQVETMTMLHENPVYLPGVEIPSDLVVSHDLAAMLEGVDDVLIVVPSFAFLDTLKKLKELRPQGLRLAWGTKGLESNTHHMFHDVVTAEYGADTPMVVLSGPSFAKEVAMSLPTAISLAGNNAEFTEFMRERLHSPMFRVYVNEDLPGVELCGVVKNVLAIAVGASDGMGFGANSRSALMTRGLAEMSRLCQAVGGSEKTVTSLAGVGDVILTCTDDQSRNRRFGLAIGRERSITAAQADIGQAIEGYNNLKPLYELAKQYNVDMPIVSSLYRVLYENADIKDEVLVLMARDPSSEPL